MIAPPKTENWLDYMIRNEHGFVIGIKDNAPADVKEYYEKTKELNKVDLK